MQTKLALLCMLRGESPEWGGCSLGPAQCRSPAPSALFMVRPSRNQALHVGNDTLSEPLANWSMCWMASKRAKGPGVPQPKEPKGPATVELREYLKGSGMGLPPNISRTVMLKKYCIYCMWFHKVEPSPIGGFEGERVFGSMQRGASSYRAAQKGQGLSFGRLN